MPKVDSDELLDRPTTKGAGSWGKHGKGDTVEKPRVTKNEVANTRGLVKKLLKGFNGSVDDE